MHYIQHVALEGFFVQIIAPGRPGPIAIVRDKVVIDVDPVARQRGIRPGMEKRTARAVAHETKFFVWEEDAFEEAQAKWLDLCTEFTGIVEPEEQNSAYLDLSSHPNPIDVSEKLVRTLAQETGLKIIYGSSCSKWIAKLASRLDDCGAAAIDPQKFLSGLPITHLSPVSPEHRQRLNFLGYRTIGDILTIPSDLIRQQFGAEGLFIAKAARGEIIDLPRALYPRDSLIETLIFEGAVDSLETIHIALKDLATRTATRLSNNGVQGQELSLSIEFENGVTKQLKRRFSKPIHNFPGALAALTILFSEIVKAVCTSASTPEGWQKVAGVSEQSPELAKEMCADPRKAQPHSHPEGVAEIEAAIDRQVNIAALRIAMTNLTPNRGKQTALLGRAKADSAEAVNVVRTVFGDTSVQLGAEIPIARRIRVLREWKNAIGWS